MFVFAIVLGVFPYQTVINFMDETITRQVDDLTEFAKTHEAEKKAEAAAASEEAPSDDDAGDEPPRPETSALDNGARISELSESVTLAQPGGVPFSRGPPKQD